MKTLNRFLLWMSGVAACSWMLTAAAADDVSPLWLRYPAVSPDGDSIAFTYGGQIWRVASSGGEAVPLTSGDFYSTRPVWSPDGQSLAIILVQQTTAREGVQDAAADLGLHRLGVARIQLFHRDEAHALFRLRLEYAVDDADVEMDVLVERGVEPMDEGHRAGACL